MMAPPTHCINSSIALQGRTCTGCSGAGWCFESWPPSPHALQALLAISPNTQRYPTHLLAGEDLHRVLWLKSRNSEVWLDRRTTYTRSTAVMSMVGYLLGLGDRHPSNLMLDRYSGKLLHIDFGDCFEASMNREKFPEKVPFRLTRMMERAMEVSGVEGNFRYL